MKKFLLSFATVIVATLGSITPAFAYDANGNPEYGDPGFNPYEEMTPEELSQAQSQRVRDSMNATLAEEGLPSTETMLTGFKLLLLLMVGAAIVKGVFYACVASNMSHTKSSSKRSTTATPASGSTPTNVGMNKVPATAATTAAVHQQSNYDMVAQTIEMMENAERNDINSLNNTF